MITQQQALEALEYLEPDEIGSLLDKKARILRQYIEQQAEDAELLDCGEAGHAESRCGNASCMMVKK